VGSPIGAAVNLSDFAIREPLAVDDSDAFDLGSHRLRFLVTPYVHQWDSMLAYDETTRTVFCSDPNPRVGGEWIFGGRKRSFWWFSGVARMPGARVSPRVAGFLGCRGR
jgi:hypothetical protein